MTESEICPCCGAKKKKDSPNLARDKHIKERYIGGVSLAELSRGAVVTEQRIRQIVGCDNLRLEDKHISLRQHESREIRNLEIYRLHLAGEKRKTISEKIGLSDWTVWQVIKKMKRRHQRSFDLKKEKGEPHGQEPTGN
jgi:Mor family transcriptional regulator